MNQYSYCLNNPLLYKDLSGNIPAVIIYVASKAPEIFLDVVLEYTISEITGEEFSTWKSALANSALDLLPIIRKINTGKKASKIIDIIGKEGLEKLRVAAGKATEMMKRGKIEAWTKYLDNVIQEIVEGAGKVGDPLSNIKYTDKVKSQMVKGDYLSFPASVDAFGKDGIVTKVTGGDGIVRDKIEIPGNYRGKQGVFQYIIEPDGVTVNHRFICTK